jgi:hypothetical protein
MVDRSTTPQENEKGILFIVKYGEMNCSIASTLMDGVNICAMADQLLQDIGMS